jgi:hypothetical protein
MQTQQVFRQAGYTCVTVERNVGMRQLVQNETEFAYQPKYRTAARRENFDLSGGMSSVAARGRLPQPVEAPSNTLGVLAQSGTIRVACEKILANVVVPWPCAVRLICSNTRVPEGNAGIC